MVHIYTWRQSNHYSNHIYSDITECETKSLGGKGETYSKVEIGFSLWNSQSREEGEPAPAQCQVSDTLQMDVQFLWLWGGWRLSGTIIKIFTADLTLRLTPNDEQKFARQTKAFQRERTAWAKTRSTQAVKVYYERNLSVSHSVAGDTGYAGWQEHSLGDVRIQFYRYKWVKNLKHLKKVI